MPYKHVAIMETCICHGNDVYNTHEHQVVLPPFVLPLESLRSEEVNLNKVPEAICRCSNNLWSSCSKHVYQVSSPW